MFLIFGFRTKAEQLGMVWLACQVCGQTGGMALVREVTKLSVFFIPLVPVRKKHVVHCPMCGARSSVSSGEARRLLASGVGSH